MLKHLMFDIDGTLIQSTDFDEQIYIESVESISGLKINSDWQSYPFVTDTGLLRTFCEYHQREEEFDHWHEQVRSRFIKNIYQHCQQHQIDEIPGAKAFIHHLQNQPDYRISFATGGWRNSAMAKLESAGFDTQKMSLFSSDDHYKRTEIMRLASESDTVVYFGDGSWDKRACEELGYGFIAVGNSIEHQTSIENYLDIGGILDQCDQLLAT